MLVAQRTKADKAPQATKGALAKLQAFARFYGIERHALARHLDVELTAN